MSKKLNYGLINLTALMLLLYIGFSNIGLWIGVVGKALSVMAPFIIGFAFAYAFTPLLNKLVKNGIPKNIGVAIIVISIILIITLLGALTIPLIINQFGSFVEGLLSFIKNLNMKFNLNLGSFEIRITDYLEDALKDVGSLATSSTVDILNKSLSFVSKFIVGFVGFIYFLADMGKIRKWVRTILLDNKERAYHYIKLVDLELTNYLKGLLIFMGIQFVEYSLLFFIVGHPNWLILGILASLTTIIPYFGGLITNLIAIFTATVVSMPLTIATIIICLIFPQLDGYVISPRIYGKTNNVNPLITIMVVSVGGTLFGIVGIVIALPCYLLARTTYHYFISDLKVGISKVKDSI